MGIGLNRKERKEQNEILKNKLKELAQINITRKTNYNPMNKKIVILNGSGGVGKDTLCNSLPKSYMVGNLSTIDRIKEIAFTMGWDGEKDSKSRKFLSDLKRISEEFNDYLIDDIIQRVTLSHKSLIFIQIREPDLIEKYKKAFEEKEFEVKTMLIRRGSKYKYGNKSDDDVENYEYDIYFDNNDYLEASLIKFRMLIKSLIEGTLILDANNLLVLDEPTTQIVRQIRREKEIEKIRADEIDALRRELEN